MYVGLLLALFALSAWLVAGGLRTERRWRVGAGVLLAAATGVFFASLSFFGELMWFDALGYGARFWTAVLAEGGLLVAGAVVAAAATWLLTLPVHPRRVGLAATALGAVIGALWGYGSWEVILHFFAREAAGVVEPILGLDAGFYLFVLPFLDALYGLLFTVAVLSLAAAVVAAVLQPETEDPGSERGAVIEFGSGKGLAVHPASRGIPGGTFRGLVRGVVVLGLVVAAGRVLAVPHLLYSEWGAVSGPGWTDVHVRLPGLLLVALVTVLASVALLSERLRERFGRWAVSAGAPAQLSEPASVAPPVALVAAVWFLVLGLVPALVQRFWVEPNEISFEAPYIAHNIALTNQGFGLDRIEEREFPAAGRFTAETVAENRELLRETRLWDWRALDAVYRQFQEIRLYYEFVDLDIDRYQIGEDYRQVMVSAREMEVGNLPEQSQTFINRHFKYTHGYGLTMAPVAEFTAQGLPRLLVKDLPPVASHPSLEVTVPQVYYGELTDSHAYVNTTESEFDYPRGDENVTIHYPGEGGVELSNLWRRFVFGWMFDGTRFFLSGYPTEESRIMFHRRVHDRVARVAPFLTLDEDPYVALVDGKIYWILDAYTTSSYFPYSQPFSSIEVIEYDEGGATRRLVGRVAPHLDGVNYVRNSVKVVVDAFEGSVDLYVFEPDDPLVRVWDRIFPGLFQPAEEMHEGLRAHVRYPADLYRVQGKLYAKYHMTDPRVFYNQEDLWVRATEKYHADVRPVEPYYVMWQPPPELIEDLAETTDAPGEQQGPDPEVADDIGRRGAVEFTTIQPFTPKNRQVMIGWLAGLSDGPNYGRLLAYKFPKERHVLGPQQVETKIDQDRFLSQQLTLWDQRGSSVIRGNVLAIPVGRSLFYVEPIYLQADTAAYPELRLVVVMHDEDLAYGETLEEALEGLVGEDVEGIGVVATPEERVLPEPEEPERRAADLPERDEVRAEAVSPEVSELAREANDAFEAYLRLQSERRFAEAAEELERLGTILDQLAGERDRQ